MGSNSYWSGANGMYAKHFSNLSMQGATATANYNQWNGFEARYNSYIDASSAASAVVQGLNSDGLSGPSSIGGGISGPDGFTGRGYFANKDSTIHLGTEIGLGYLYRGTGTGDALTNGVIRTY
jgi:hypothetical protein